ncbi:SPOC domain-like protein [Violaceomyces palustris]|uniref:SPOC domain-like protein n=1 Tax=Violaceomyces palustris TaxID=1673888 RepID=A0ACD0P8U0_9BASI|nr:SPOC domain-like protein [Violaceomyces palustris]
MSVVARSITLFAIDVSASMGRPRTVSESTFDAESATLRVGERRTTDLEWVTEFVSAKISEIILRGLKTAKAAVILYGSSRTHNVVNDSGIVDQYEGIDEIFRPDHPTLEILDKLKNLRAVEKDPNILPGDPLAALVDAIQLSNSPEYGGLKDSLKGSWKRTIYLLTDGRSHFSRDGADTIKDKIKAEGIQLRILGIDFDDPLTGFRELNKSRIKEENERFWNDFLHGIPDARIATAEDAIQQARLPSIQLTTPAPSRSILTFGSAEDLASKEAIRIPICQYKMTEAQRPMTQVKISRIAQDKAKASVGNMSKSHPVHGEASVDEEEVTFRVNQRKEYYVVEDVGSAVKDKETAKPLPEEAETAFKRAWKLGATLVPVPNESLREMDTRAGMEILHFSKADKYRREYSLDQIWFVFADPDQQKSQVELSSLVKALAELELIAIVRNVRKDRNEPELGVLMPCVEETYDCFYYTRAPFREDVKKFIFPPLDRILKKDGREVRNGPNLPSEEQQREMDDFVDAMDLMHADKDDSGNTIPWFDVLDSFNPAIHNLKNAVKYRFVNPENHAIPGPHGELVKFFETPLHVLQRSQPVIEHCRSLFRVEYLPPKGNSIRKRNNHAAMLADEEAAPSPSQNPSSGKESRAVKAKKMVSKLSDEGDETEDEEATSLMNLVKPELQDHFPITEEDPVEKFRELIESEKDVTGICKRMQATIESLLHAPQDSLDYDKIKNCIVACKDACAEYEEALSWNTFIRSIKPELIRNHRLFWEGEIKGRTERGLITEDQDEAGESKVNDEEARVFVTT